MKKYIPYILVVVLAAAVVTMVITGEKNKRKKLNEKMTLSRKDKIPYGMNVAFSNLKYLFPGAAVSINTYEPGYWESLSSDESDQLLVIVTERFGADKDEMEELVDFAEKGNDVFISSMNISAAADDIFNCTSSALDLTYLTVEELDENLRFSLNNPPFQQGQKFSYPGRTFSSYFTDVDTLTTTILGQDIVGRPNFIHLRAGKGNFFVHLEPLAFSNYFLMHKSNLEFYEKAMSLIRPEIKEIAWDEYYLNKRESRPPKKKTGWMNVLMNAKNSAGQRPFRAALWTGILLLLLFVLLEMRRKQRPIPVIKKPKNDSLDFVKTIGRLYYDKADHRNLCRKMSAYFLEHVRNKYKLPTGIMDEAFIKNLHFKSGAGESEIRELVSNIKDVEKAASVSPAQLTGFHKRLEAFYKKT